MDCVSRDISLYHLWFVCAFPWGIPQLQSDWSLSCDHGLDYASPCENNNNNLSNSVSNQNIIAIQCIFFFFNIATLTLAGLFRFFAKNIPGIGFIWLLYTTEYITPR